MTPLTAPMLAVLGRLVATDAGPAWRASICQDTGLSRGEVRYLLDQLVEVGWVVTRAGTSRAGLGGARRYHVLTPSGRRAATTVLLAAARSRRKATLSR